MIKKITLSCLMLLTAVLFSINGKASHVPGGNITYECIGPNQFKVILTLFEDCGTAFAGNGPLNIGCSNSCGYANPTIQLQNVIYQQEVSQLCPTSISQSECNGGSLPGIYMHRWEGTVTLPGQCNSWTFSYSLCCRNTSSNLVGQGTFYIETQLNSVTAPCNNSVVIQAQPIPYVCANQNVYYSFGAADADGDSLTFSFIGARSAAATFIGYQGTYTATSPITGISLNPTTGLITFNTPNIGNYVVAVLITEYDENGLVTGTVVQDFQFQVINCTNQTPIAPPQITNYSGGGNLVLPDNVNLCVGESACFDLVFSDPDTANILNVDAFFTSLPPNCSYTVTGTNPLTVNVCVTAQPSSGATYSILSINVKDDACPINATANFNVLLGSFGLGFSVTTTDASCPGVNNGSVVATADTSGVYDFSWYALPDSTNTIYVETNVTSGSTLSGVGPGDYMVVISDTTGGCAGIQFVTIDPGIVPYFNVTVTDEVCSGAADGSITATANNGTGPWDYIWASSAAPSTILQNNQNLAGASTFNNASSGSYILTIVDANGCTSDTTIVVGAGIVVNSTNSTVGETCYQQGNGSITLSGSGGTGPYTYVIAGPEADTLMTTTFTNLTAGTYTAYVIDANGCFATVNNVVVAAAPQLIASFTPASSTGVPPYSVTFTNTSQNAATYYWDFGDTTNSIVTNPTHIYDHENTFIVMLVAVSANGMCFDTTYGEIITATSHLDLPNVFSPNGDGSNDVFHFNAKNISTFSCVIFDRWGLKMYEFSDAYGSWNGKDKGGKEVPEGTYYYILDAVGVDGIVYKHHGSVNVFRKK